MNTNVTEQVLELAPEEILADKNLRFGLKAERVADLAEEIKEVGRVLTPLWVMPLDTPVDGCTHRLTAGHYRREAVIKLNREGAGLKLPCIIRDYTSEVERMKLQVAENYQRNDMSLMDKAVAMKDMLDAGVPRIEVRKIFATPGGRKGNKSQPASNSWMNIVVSFLQFPKKIQEKIHAGPGEGGIGFATAYELTKVAREKWEEVLADAEAARLKAVEADEKAEEKYLADQGKLKEAEDKTQKLSEDLEAKKKELQVVSQQADELSQKSKELYAAAKAKPTTDEEKKSVEEAKAKLKEVESAEAEKAKAAAGLKKETDKIQERLEAAKKTAEERAQKLRELRIAAQKKQTSKAPGPQDIKKAAAAAGAATGLVPLTRPQIGKVLDEWLLPGPPQKWLDMVKVIKRCFDSELTPDQALWEACFRAGFVEKKPKHMEAADKAAAQAEKKSKKANSAT